MKKIPYYPSTIALPMRRYDAVSFVIVTLTGFFIRVGNHHTYPYFLLPDMRLHFTIATMHLAEF